MSALSEVQSWMNFYGWTEGGAPGSIKIDALGITIAKHGDAQWKRDVEHCCYRAEMAKRDRDLIDEVEAALSAGQGTGDGA